MPNKWVRRRTANAIHKSIVKGRERISHKRRIIGAHRTFSNHSINHILSDGQRVNGETNNNHEYTQSLNVCRALPKI